MYQAIFYTTERGDSPIDEFLDGLDKKSRAKVEAHISLLEELGPNLKSPMPMWYGEKSANCGYISAQISIAFCIFSICVIR